MKFLRCSEGLFLGLRCKIIENTEVLTLQMSLNEKSAQGYIVIEMKGVDLQQRRSKVVVDFVKGICLV